MSNLIIHNLIFWPIWALISVTPGWLMQKRIDQVAATVKQSK